MSFEISLRPSKDTGGMYYKDSGYSDGIELSSMPLKRQDLELAENFCLEAVSVKEDIIVSWEENDQENPKNWSRAKRWYTTGLSSMLVLNATFASSAPAGVIPTLVHEFQVSSEVGVLVLSSFIAGYCLGPLLWGPLSEQYGRRPVFIASFSLYMIFQILNSVATSMNSILVFRLIGGIFAAAPLSNSGAVIGDIWDPSTRGKALSMFTLAPFAGPALGPTISGYLTVAGVRWNWIFWLLTIFAGVCLLLVVSTLPETYSPVLLRKKACRLRATTGNTRYIAPIEMKRHSFRQRVEAILLQPFRVLFFEPMLIAITIYMSFMYGCIYLLFEAYPIVFGQGHNLDPGASGLMLLNLPIGGVIGVLTYFILINPRYDRAIQRYAPAPVPPETRLEMGLIGAPLFAIAFFWFAWTSYPSIHLAVPFVSGVLMGWAIYLIFLCLVNYIVDAYLSVAASALAANTVVRSLTGAAFPLFATQMYESLNPRWASTVLGCIAAVLMPLPFVLIKFGPRLRRYSRYAPSRPVPGQPREVVALPSRDGVASRVPGAPRDVALAQSGIARSDSCSVHIPLARKSSHILPPEAYDVSVRTLPPAKLSS
ncbi:MFS general substrate transporter [Coprinopsis marcescibilis]|uniref:MFS general substrate transporter n=1 Tax=Coprinopsis marcescibilis TaxID=230819 RepID=A0A5C3LKH5_COPMA|nr:MFS general substrate transporter [Coprinopsis marcescibilis]